ncbi:hypothetical protein ART_1988 [Arthrobacter sp. PAMC 25486]|nr:hypothetical protein ART_1988 [Arthrobacter sp. PAMC 25486]
MSLTLPIGWDIFGRLACHRQPAWVAAKVQQQRGAMAAVELQDRHVSAQMYRGDHD